MLAKLLSLAAAGLLVASMGGAAAASHSQEDRDRDECETGKPVIVAQRNEAAHEIRAAFKDEHHRLTDARGSKAVDHKTANQIIRTADRELRDVVAQALDDVAALTLGRNGHLRETPAPSPSTSPTASPTATPTPTPTPTATASPTAAPTCAPKASPAAGTEEHGRTEVFLGAGLQLIVDEASAEMKAIVDQALADVATLPTAQPKQAKPSNDDRGEHGKSEGKGRRR